MARFLKNNLMLIRKKKKSRLETVQKPHNTGPLKEFGPKQKGFTHKHGIIIVQFLVLECHVLSTALST